MNKRLNGLAGIIEPLARKAARPKIQRLLGFWVMYNAYGCSIPRMVEVGVATEPSAYRQRAEFRLVFGCEVEDWQPDLAAAFVVQREALAAKNAEQESVTTS